MPAIPYACPVCGRRYVVVAGDAAPPIPSCGCGAPLAEAPLAGGVYEIRRARRASQRPRALSPEAEPDHGYGESHGYGPAHGGPTGPGDAPATSEEPNDHDTAEPDPTR
ncbi:Hypothetical protein A7982_03502 [Minicystis rosea]|nr:Hypothetical protein A7982_03502 [Minicystis rosea]